MEGFNRPVAWCNFCSKDTTPVAALNAFLGLGRKGMRAETRQEVIAIVKVET